MLHNKRYHPSKYSGLTAKYVNTKLTFMIFKSGNVVITGGKTEKLIEEAANDLIYVLRLLGGYETKLLNFKFTNFCASHKFTSKIDLHKLCLERKDQCDYEPQIFTSLKYNIENKKLTLTHNGVLFGTGFKSREQINQIFDKAINELTPYLSE